MTLQNSAETERLLRSLFPHDDQAVADTLHQLAEFTETAEVEPGVSTGWLLRLIERDGVRGVADIKRHLNLWKTETL